MKLSEQDGKLFFKLMGALQFFANRKLKIFSEIQEYNDYAALEHNQKIKIRNAIFDDVKIIDVFVKENPDDFTKEELNIVLSWKNFIKGNFFIERILKKHNIFIQDEKVYAVLALLQGIEELNYYYSLPLYVETVLLPFKGEIVYDGFLSMSSMSFGGNFTRSLKETYMRAKQNNRIIDTFEVLPKREIKQRNSKPVKNWQPELDELAKQVKRLKGSVNSPTIHGASFGLVKASVEFARLVVSNTGDYDDLRQALEKVRRAYNKSSTVLNRED